ncbi:MAG: hypothetical protein ACYDD4_12835 [Acidimicrobiales bacterium]
MDIEQFYSQDERRRQSEEIELGTDWTDAHGLRYELSWVADTGELYVMREPADRVFEDPFGDVFAGNVPVNELQVAVVGYVPSLDQLGAIIRGWEDRMLQPGSISWVAERLAADAVPRQAPQS